MPTLDDFSLDNFGLGGADGKVNYASGSYTVTTATRTFLRESNTVQTYRYVLAGGLPFRPKKIIIRVPPSQVLMPTIYDFNTRKASPTTAGTNYNHCFLNGGDFGQIIAYRTFEYINGIQSASYAGVSDDSFILPVDASAGDVVTWEAYG
ncbi:hypothetical protein [Paenibacillus xylanexedens]|uniref:hypothetical protein n=1 Tax=Paenibacillus xylanexedens TaxID=528191 RepID=UPI00119EFF1A|nr:hypothetical protein [Paenibacillus xylanexedens]